MEISYERDDLSDEPTIEDAYSFIFLTNKSNALKAWSRTNLCEGERDGERWRSKAETYFSSSMRVKAILGITFDANSETSKQSMVAMKAIRPATLA